MKQVKTLSIFLTLLSVFTSCQENKKSSLTILSDQIPTVTPTIFGEGIISTDNYLEGSITFSPDMSELYFNRIKPEERPNIYTMKLIDGKWSEPTLASFTNKEYLDFHSRISPKGDILYFGSTRPLNDTIESSGLNQWYVKKNVNGWGQPIPLGKPFADRYIMCTMPSENGNLYFNSKEKGDKLEDEGIYYAINQDGHYATVERLGKAINSPGKWIAHPFIAPDESYIIYDAERTDIPENGDLFISFNINGIWTESYNLGPKINTKLSEGGATVSPDGKYLFFGRAEEKIREDGSTYWTGNIYWVDFIQLKKELIENSN